MTPSRSAVWRWRAISLIPFYAAITLGVASVAAPPAPPLLPQLQTMAARVADALPGAGLWPSMLDLHGKIAGDFPLPLAGMTILMLMFFGAAALAQRISARISRDEATAHDERIRERERRKMREQ